MAGFDKFYKMFMEDHHDNFVGTVTPEPGAPLHKVLLTKDSSIVMVYNKNNSLEQYGYYVGISHGYPDGGQKRMFKIFPQDIGEDPLPSKKR